MKRLSKYSAVEIFYLYEEKEQRLPTKKEWEIEYYGRVCDRNESNYYYSVKRKYLAEREANES